MSHIPRAGWAGGMLSASKLYQSVSISGPSATSNPMPTNTSSSASRVWVTRWRWPRAAGAATEPGMNSVRSSRLSAISRASSSAAISARRLLEQLLDGGPGLVQPLARAPCGRRGRARRAPGRPRPAPTSCRTPRRPRSRISSVVPAPAMAARASSTSASMSAALGHPGLPVPPAPASTGPRGPAGVGPWARHRRHRARWSSAAPGRHGRGAGGGPRSTARRPTRSRSATRPARHRDRHRCVEPASSEVLVEPGRLVAEHQGHPLAPVERGVVDPAAHCGAHQVMNSRVVQLLHDCVGAAPPATTGTWKSDPADARTVFGLVGSTVPSQQTTASTPAASAVRIIVPALPGSRTSTHTTTIDWSLTSSRAAGSEAHHRHHRLGGDGVGHPLDDPGARSKTRTPAANASSTTAATAGLARPSGATYTDSTADAGVQWPPTAARPLPPPAPPRMLRRLRLRRSCRTRRTR